MISPPCFSGARSQRRGPELRLLTTLSIKYMGKFLYLQNEKIVRCHLDVNTCFLLIRIVIRVLPNETAFRI